MRDEDSVYSNFLQLTTLGKQDNIRYVVLFSIVRTITLAYGAKMTLDRRRCDVITSHRR